ncbi:MAG: methyltransferase domain-containing protein [Candidatus Aminicenantes bacterium]|nr:methyltransferase domain-containing protein [Candidatus Aminicenantes bacterium]
MKKNSITVLCTIFFVISSIGFSWQDQEHQHKHTGLKQYEERQKRYEDRLYWQMPRRVMNELDIGPGMHVADVGSGIGYFTLKLSKRVGRTGKVYASDIDENALAFLDKSRKEAGLDNISIIHGKEDDPMIPKASVDLVLIVNTIHLVKEKTVFLNNIRNSLKEKGKLVFIQWDAQKMDSELPGWDSKDRELYTMHTMLKVIYDANYEVLEIKDFLPMQLIYICQPSDASK